MIEYIIWNQIMLLYPFFDHSNVTKPRGISKYESFSVCSSVFVVEFFDKRSDSKPTFFWIKVHTKLNEGRTLAQHGDLFVEINPPFLS